MKFIYLALVAIFFSACAKDSGVPAYIYVDNASLATDYSKEGSAACKITDVWVTVNSKSIGVFELPAKIPILETGMQSVFISPGIKVNGISASRAPYPFYLSYEGDVILQPGEVTRLSTPYHYAPFAIFDWLEDFEGIGTSFVSASNSQANMQFISDKNTVFEGNQCGMVYLGAGKYSFSIGSEKSYKLSKEGASVFLELNYMITGPLRVSLLANYSNSTEPVPVMTLNATIDDSGAPYWNKIYINLSSAVTNSTNANSFKVIFSADKETEDDAYFFFDNIKLLHQ